MEANNNVKGSYYIYLSVIYMTRYELQISGRLLLLNLLLCFEYLCRKLVQSSKGSLVDLVGHASRICSRTVRLNTRSAPIYKYGGLRFFT